MTAHNDKLYGETCIICEEHKTKGFHLYHSFICLNCENEIVQTNTNDPKYQYFIEKLKKAANPKIYS